MTALLSYPAKEDDVPKYAENAEDMGIKVCVPDINRSNRGFTLDKDKKEILFGLESVKGVGESSIDTIIECRPYNGIEDALERLPKKVFNKRVGTALIKSGAFSFENENRYELLNQYYSLRKDKEEEIDVTSLDKYKIIDMETEVLGIPITYKPWWSNIKEGQVFEDWIELEDVEERIDKNGNMMAFIRCRANYCELNAIAFASCYCNNVSAFEMNGNKVIKIKGKKGNKDKKTGQHKLIISKVLEIEYNNKNDEEVENIPNGVSIPF